MVTSMIDSEEEDDENYTPMILSASLPTVPKNTG